MINKTTTIDLIVKDLIADTDSSEDRYVNYIRLAKHFLETELPFHFNSLEKKTDLSVASSNIVTLPVDFIDYVRVIGDNDIVYTSKDFKISKDRTTLTFDTCITPASIKLYYIANDIDVYTYQIDNRISEAMKAYINWKFEYRKKNISMADKRELRMSYVREMNLAKIKISPFRLDDANKYAERQQPYMPNIRL